ncbi:hypothetical protein [Pseudorhodobacter sp.]|uniref:hypothetical protein n=1 Tax=Pseudorhodobacter sp. TaxID=1934400 RepID=UPI002AFE2010|nr:hypothetical protein [Pseudorhodobacter sp.]
MADGLPPMEMDFGANGAPIVIVEQAEVGDVAGLLTAAPALMEPKWVFALAQMSNHLAQGESYELIVDVAAFKADYMAAYEAEDPDEDVAPGAIRLHNFGIPDFDAMQPPRMEGNTLVFFAENIFMGIPYRAVMQPGGQPVYEPVAMVQ